MIGLLQGQVVFLEAPTACIMTASGVGYDVELPIPSFCQLILNAEAQVWTHLHVREDAQLLFGFIERSEREVFRQLIKINGVGAKMALAMLSSMPANELKMHVEADNEAALTRIPGIGKKTAQRLLIELKGKLKDVEGISPTDSTLLDTDSTHNYEGSILAEVESALIGLGYKPKEAQQAIKATKINLDGEDVDTQSLLRASLRQLSTF